MVVRTGTADICDVQHAASCDLGLEEHTDCDEVLSETQLADAFDGVVTGSELDDDAMSEGGHEKRACVAAREAALSCDGFCVFTAKASATGPHMAVCLQVPAPIEVMRTTWMMMTMIAMNRPVRRQRSCTRHL